MKKKRKADIIHHHNLYKLSIFTLVLFVLSILIFNINPIFFTDSYNKLKNNLNKSFDQSILLKKISNINLNFKHKDKDFSSLDNIQIEGKSYVIYDVNHNKILGSKNENQILPLASLTKVVTAITSINIAGRDKDIIIKKNYMRPDESLDKGLSENQKWKLNELLRYGLTISSNSSMDIIANTVSDNNLTFVNKMNQYVKDLGYKDFVFNSASGLDYGDIIGGKGTSLEYAELFAKSYTLIPDIMSYTINSKINLNSNQEKIYQIPNTNTKASTVVGLLASKTGFTDAAGGNLAIMFNEDVSRPIVIVVLGSSLDGRFTDVNKLYKATKEILER